MKLKIGATFFLSIWFVSLAFGLTKMTSVALINSTIDSTPIGVTTPASGSFTTLFANSAGVNSHIGYVGASAAFLGFNVGGVGDADIIAANGGSSPQFALYYLLGSGLTKEFWLDSSANAHFNAGVTSIGGFTGNLTGNVTGNLSGNATTSSSTTGNAATATALAATPSSCSTGYQHVFAIAANGNGSCGTPVYAITAATSTASAAGSTASITGNLTWKFGGVPGSVLMPDTNYAVSCTGVNPSGAPSIQGVTKTTSSVTVTIQNGQGSQAVASGYSEVDCTVTGS